LDAAVADIAHPAKLLSLKIALGNRVRAALTGRGIALGDLVFRMLL
jgi:hypothetical protein